MATKNSTEKAYQRAKANIKPNWVETRATLTPRESTKITGFGVSQTYRLLRTNRMPHILVGKRFFIPKSALLKWLEACGSTVTAA